MIHRRAPIRSAFGPVGEGGIIPVAAALTNAIARAIDPNRTGHELPLFTLPLKPERIYTACQLAAENTPQGDKLM